ncbi:hypothetical protein M758_1G244800 [Ceratodon purpureus]|uniref:nepenthesin n=1 Tax=Ceratodon purpureus TaxID=3225 RepID=A0A8T0JBN9_CERPU|nr:hypothetical protein KC19_1G250200 [Ceratodon purpureus]KAG0631331.1 hypothetical protein M758_1G244800 [Ceratodon purpureus]
MAIVVRDTMLCALVLLQLLSSSLCYEGVRVHGGRKLELPKRRGLAHADEANVLRSYLVHRDSLETGTNTTAKPRNERFLDAVKRSQSRVNQLQKSLKLTNVEAAAADLNSPVSAGSGEYVMQFSVGTPAQRFTAIVDTGSDLCWVQCSPCMRCFQQPDAVFNPLASSTYRLANCTDSLCRALPGPICSRANTCTYAYAYGDGSNTRGDLAYETVTLNSAVSHIGFGCGHYQVGTFAGADGLIGLGQGPLSLPSQLSPSVAEIFSYCLVEQTTTDSGSSPITFGNAAENSAATYTPLLTNTLNPTYYYVGVTGISVGSSRVSIPSSAFRISSNGGGGVILDSGTTLTYWTNAAFNPILAAFRRQISYSEVDASTYGLNLCYDVSSVSASSLTLPAMVVHFTNVDLEVPVSNLFSYVDNAEQTICLTMAPSDQFSIIGNIVQQNNLIVYDVVNRRVGFQAFDCATL